MRIVAFNGTIDIDVGKHGHGFSVSMKPGVRYVMASAPFNALVQDNPQLSKLLAGTALLEPRLSPFVAQPDGGGSSVLFYTGAGGLGDQVMAWPVVRWLAKHNYKVTVISDPGNDVCWQIHPDVQRVLPLPLPYDVFSAFSHHAIFEVVTNVDSFADQDHPTDCLFKRLGVDPRSVSMQDRKVTPRLPISALARRHAGRAHGVFQLAATNAARSLPLAECQRLAEQLASRTADKLDWIVVADQSNKAHLDMKLPTGMKLVTNYTFDQLVGLCLKASLGVGPDSLMMHLCGSLDIPFVAYFGPIAPPLRTRYYSSVRAAYSQGACPLAPCHAFSLNHAPVDCPTADRGFCRVTTESANHAVAQVLAILGNR